MGLFSNMAILYLCIAIAISFWQPTLVLGNSPQAQSVLNFFNVGIDDSGNPMVASTWNNQTSDASDRLLAQGRQNDKDNSAVNIFLSIIDVTWNTIVYISLFFRVLFAPLIILLSPAMAGIPTALVFVIGIPLVFMGLLSIIMIIRGVN